MNRILILDFSAKLFLKCSEFYVAVSNVLKFWNQSDVDSMLVIDLFNFVFVLTQLISLDVTGYLDLTVMFVE